MASAQPIQLRREYLGAKRQSQSRLSSNPLPDRPIQTPVLHRLAHVGRLDRRGPGEIGDRPRDLENPVIRPRREPEPVNGQGEQRVRAVGGLAVPGEIPGRHVRVGKEPAAPGESLELDLPRAVHAFADRCARLAARLAGEIAIRHGGHLEVDVDPVEQGAGHAGQVTLDADGAARTGSGGVTEVAARTPLRSPFAMST